MAVLPPDPIFYFKSDMGHIHSICFATKTDGYVSHLLAATEKGTVYFWDLETNRLQHKQEMGESIQVIHCLGERIVTQEKCGKLKLWEATEEGCGYEVTLSCECNMGFCRSIVGPYEDELLSPGPDGSVDVIDVETLKTRKRLVPDRQDLGFLMALEKLRIADQDYVLGGYETGDVLLWSIDQSEPRSHLKLREKITGITFDSSIRRGVCGNASNLLQIFTIDKSLKITLKCEVSITNDGCNCVKLRQDNKIFASGGWDGRVQLFSWKSLRKLVVLAEHKAAITDVQFSPSAVSYWGSNIMAVSGADGTITLWSLYN